MSESSRPNLHILIADDEPVLRGVIAEFLDTIDDCTYAEAADGVEALEYLRQHPVDCLLSDIRMPRMGLEGLLVHVEREFPDLMVIGSSGYSDLDSAAHILIAGAHEFLAKPLDLDQLEQSLEWLRDRVEILRMTRDLFAGEEEGRGSEVGSALEALASRIRETQGPFRGRLAHACRTADLVDIVLENEDLNGRRALHLAALMHEIGTSTLGLKTTAEERRLASVERDFVRTHYEVAGRMLDRVLPSSTTSDVVRSHLDWLGLDPAQERSWSDTQKMSCLLGALNVVDALLQDRADRGALSLDQAHSFMKKLYLETNFTAVKQTLSAWDKIEAYYAH